MRTLKKEIGRIFGMRIEGPSEASGKRRQPNLEELVKMDRPGSLCKVVGFLLLSQEQLKQSSRK